jgi:hypothetical protein
MAKKKTKNTFIGIDYETAATPKAQADGVPVFCSHDAIIGIEKAIPNPKNPNQHDDKQSSCSEALSKRQAGDSLSPSAKGAASSSKDTDD